MNGEVCCILGVCCPQGSQAQAEALAGVFLNEGVCKERDEAVAVAKSVLSHFDLAPHGSLTALKTEIAKMARHRA